MTYVSHIQQEQLQHSSQPSVNSVHVLLFWLSDLKPVPMRGEVDVHLVQQKVRLWRLCFCLALTILGLWPGLVNFAYLFTIELRPQSLHNLIQAILDA